MIGTLAKNTGQLQCNRNDNKAFTVNVFWDAEALTWIATCDDIHGLLLEDKSYDDLMREVRYAIPELLEVENLPCNDFSFAVAVKPIEELIADG